MIDNVIKINLTGIFNNKKQNTNNELKPVVTKDGVIWGFPESKNAETMEANLTEDKFEKGKKLPVTADEYIVIEKERPAVPSNSFGYRSNSREDVIRTKSGISSKNINGNLVLNNYDCNIVNAVIKRTKSNLTEEDIFKGVTKISGNCNLKGTTLKSSGNLKEIMGRLSVDGKINSIDLSGIKKIAGALLVHNVESKEELTKFIKSSGLSNAKVLGKIIKI